MPRVVSRPLLFISWGADRCVRHVFSLLLSFYSPPPRPEVSSSSMILEQVRFPPLFFLVIPVTEALPELSWTLMDQTFPFFILQNFLFSILC